MKSRNSIRAEINTIYRARVFSWITEHVKDNHEIQGFPFRIYLGAPTLDEEVEAQKDAFIAFCDDWHKELAAGRVDFLEKEYKGIGKVEVPVHLVFDNPDEIVTWAGHIVEYHTALKRLDLIAEKLPQLIDSAIDNITTLTTLDDIDFGRFVDVCCWIINHRNSGRLIREMKIRGVDTTWFEGHRGLLLVFLRPYLKLDPLRKDLLQLGLVPPPALVRIVVLDHVLREKVGNLRYLALPVKELGELDVKPSRVIFMEDVASALSLPDVPGTIVIITPSHSLAAVCKTPWIANARCSFSGSIDLRSFVMLNNVRVYLPETTSFLMDTSTFLNNKDLWTFDDVSAQDLVTPTALTPDERSMYTMLSSGVFGLKVRIAQERIPYEMLCAAIGAKVPVEAEHEESDQDDEVKSVQADVVSSDDISDLIQKSSSTL